MKHAIFLALLITTAALTACSNTRFSDNEYRPLGEPGVPQRSA